MKGNFGNVLALLYASLIALNSIGQTNNYKVQLPEVLPASPEATAFMKAGLGMVNMSTGGASASIPLYTIKVKDFTFPISLSYSTQGLKADEASSRVGLGWALNATGMITRSVRGKPDEYAQRLPIPADLSAFTDQTYNYLQDASSPGTGGDTQADEFQFNVNGVSGKFVLDNNYVPRVTSSSNIRVNVQILVTPNSTAGYIGNIALTTPDGIKYSFGSKFERTTDHNIGFNNPFRAVTKTAFFLDRIELPTGESIDFTYTAINTRVETGTTQTLQLAKPQTVQCSDCLSHNSYTSKTDRVEYSSYFLNGITTSTGLSITLGYEPRTDLSYDNRLKTLEVIGLKKYLFDYYDVPIISGSYVTTGRFFLTKVTDIKLSNPIAGDGNYVYDLTYNDLANVPLPISFKQDYMGFSRGNTGQNYFIPTGYNAGGGTTMDFSYRDPIPSAAMLGTLKMIKYPTGGTEEFVYEANTRAERQMRNTLNTYEFGGMGGGSNGTYEQVVQSYPNVTVPSDQTVTMDLKTIDPNPSDGWSMGPTQVTFIVSIYEGTTLVSSRSILGYSTSTTTVMLYAGHSYRVELTIKNYTVGGSCFITYDTSPVPIYDTVNVIMPGIRVKQIKYTDPVAPSTYSKYYTYGTLERPDLSTGGEYGRVDYSTTSNVITYCGDYGAFITDCRLEVYSSSSTNELYNLASSAGLLYYTNVIESDDPNFVNGGTEYTFYDNDNGGNHQTVLGNDIPYLQAGQYPTLAGSVFKTRVFNKNKEIVKEEINEHETLIYLDNQTTSINVKKRYEPYPTREDRNQAFDAIKTHYGEWWIRQKSKTVKSYAAGVVSSQKTSFEYGDRFNILPAAVLTTDSKGGQWRIEKKYPTEGIMPSPDPQLVTAVNSALVARNMISPVIQEASYLNGTLQQQKRIIYKDWFNNNTILAPEKVLTKQSPADVLSDNLIFQGYSNKGNIIQVKKDADFPIVYLWDDIHSLPLGEFRNAAIEQVAFTSFETGAVYGNWNLFSGAVNTVPSPVFTGTHAFTGVLTKSIAIAGTYIVQLWTKGTATVNTTSGTLVKSARGWSLLQWKLTNPSTVTVQGTDVDDVCIFPDGAQAAFFTYIPFVGVSSKADMNGNVAYYEYDERWRLVRIRDVDSNIVKQFTYRNEVIDHAGAIWQTTGVTRCKPCPQNGTYTVNVLQNEEKDNNPGSVTFNQTRWVDTNTPGNCVISPDWQNTGNNQCLTNTFGYRTGVLRIEKRDLNPCSGTYNQLQYQDVTDTVACTKNTPIWQATGATRCKPCAANTNYLINMLQNEERDMNPHSATYNQLRWEDSETAGPCTLTSGWQNTATAVRCKVVNGDNTGEQEQEQRDLNPCSPTYNNTRWIVVGNNPSACPLPCNTSNCSGNDKKCVNGVCETGGFIIVSSVWKKVTIDGQQVWKWECTRKYCFSDGTQSAYSWVTYHDTSCSMQGCLVP